MISTFSGICNACRLVHLSKTLNSIIRSCLFKLISRRFLQPSNARAPIDLIPVGRLYDIREVQKEKALAPIDLIPLGKVQDIRDEQ